MAKHPEVSFSSNPNSNVMLCWNFSIVNVQKWPNSDLQRCRRAVLLNLDVVLGGYGLQMSPFANIYQKEEWLMMFISDVMYHEYLTYNSSSSDVLL